MDGVLNYEHYEHRTILHAVSALAVRNGSRAGGGRGEENKEPMGEMKFTFRRRPRKRFGSSFFGQLLRQPMVENDAEVKRQLYDRVSKAMQSEQRKP